MASKVKLGVILYLISKPASDWLDEFSPEKLFPTANGFTCKFRPGAIPFNPLRVPPFEMVSNFSKGSIGLQYMSSLLRRIRRSKLIPQSCSASLGLNRKLVNGKAISISQPYSLIEVFASTIPSQARLMLVPSLLMYISLIAPAGLNKKPYPLLSSLNVSSMMAKQSLLWESKSCSKLSIMIFSGSESYKIAETYK